MSRRKDAAALAPAPGPTGELYDPTAADQEPTQDAPPPVVTEQGAAAPVTMYDASGVPHEVSSLEAPRLFLGGQAFFSKDQQVHVKDQRGHIYQVTPNEASQAFASGMQIATPKEVADALERKEQNTIGKSLEAGAVGVGRGLTLGLSDPLAIGVAGALGGEESAKATREHLAKLREHHGLASTVGEVAGAVAPVLLSGGAGAAEEGLSLGGAIRGAGILPRAAAGVGEAAGGAVRSLIGEGATSLAGRLAQRAIPLAAQAGMEGAIYGVGSTISEAALGDEELTAEKLLAGAKHGAVLGALTGGTLGAAYELGKAGLDAGLRLAGKEGLQSWLQSVADSQTVRALGANARDIKNLGGMARSTEQAQERIGEIADTVRGYHFEDGSKLFHGTSTTSQLADDLPKAVDEAGAKLGKFRSKVAELTRTNAELAPDAMGYFKRLDDEILNPAINEGGTGARRARMAAEELATLRKAAEAGPVQLEDLTKARMRLDKVLFPDKSYGVLPPPAEHAAELFQARNMLEQTIEEATDRAIAKSGNPDLVGSYQELKSTFRDLMDAKRMATAADMRALSRNTVSLSDKMAAGSVLAGSLASGGDPLLAGAKALGAGAINRAVLQRGNAMLATAADKAATIVGLNKAVTASEEHVSSALNAFLSDEHEAELLAEHIGHVSRETVKTAIEKQQETQVPRLTGPEPEAPRPAPVPKTPQGKFDRASESIEQMRDPRTAAEHVSELVGPIAQHAPGTASAVASKLTTTAAYLSGKMPKPKFDTIYPAYHSSKEPNDVERAAFLRQLDGTDPDRVLRHLKDGTISHDEVESFKATSPRLAQEAGTKLVEKLGDKTAAGKTIPYEKTIAASTFLGAPLHPTLEPGFIQLVQQMHAQKSGASGQSANAAPSSPKRKLNIAGSFATGSQRLGRMGE